VLALYNTEVQTW